MNQFSLNSIIPRGMLSATKREYVVSNRKLPMFIDAESAFIHLYGEEGYAFWLDSSRVEQGLARFSYMGTIDGPQSQIASYDTNSKILKVLSDGSTEQFMNRNIFEYLKSELHTTVPSAEELPFDFCGGFVGYFGYELKADCGTTNVHTARQPDAIFFFVDRFIVFDHDEQVIYLVAVSLENDHDSAQHWIDITEERLRQVQPVSSLNIPETNGESHLEIEMDQNYSEYIESIKRCQIYIRDGETYEVCLTNRLKVDHAFDPLLTYRILRRTNPAPYACFLRMDTFNVLSSSPERFLRIDRDRNVEAKPIKGTIARGESLEEDLALAQQLRTSEKDRAENLMIVDLLRNDLGQVCEIGSVHVPILMGIESYQTVHQMVSTIRGKVRDDLSVIDCIQAAFPGGSMTGAPKLRTMSYIDQLERSARGIYSGAIGFLGLNGTGDFNIVIRTIVMNESSAEIGAGGAVVIQSDPDQEYQEIMLKSRALIQTLTLSDLIRAGDPPNKNNELKGLV